MQRPYTGSLAGRSDLILPPGLCAGRSTERVKEGPELILPSLTDAHGDPLRGGPPTDTANFSILGEPQDNRRSYVPLRYTDLSFLVGRRYRVPSSTRLRIDAGLGDHRSGGNGGIWERYG